VSDLGENASKAKLDELFLTKLRLSRLDPRARLIAALILIIQLVLIPLDPALLVVGLLLFMFVFMGRPPLKRLAFGLITIAWMLALTIILHAFTTPGNILWTVPGVGWMMTTEGVQNGCLLAGRLSALVLIGVTLSLSLSALEVIRAMDVLLYPLARIGIPVGSLSLMLGMTLRFVPSLYQEALVLRKALRARGWEAGTGMISRVRAWIPLFIPLLANALRRADDLAETLVLRGYDPKASLGSYGLSTWNRRDTWAIAVCALPILLWIGPNLWTS
jgi:energy-coupling factor transport system permease protein